MSSAALSRDLFRPPRRDGIRRGLVFALIAHGLLIAALTFSVNWRASEPEGIEAELWASTPQIAAPKAVEPDTQPPPPPPPPAPAPKPEPKVEPPPKAVVAPPPPAPAPDPQIAIEREKREKQKLERLREQQAQEQADKRREQQLAAKEAADKKAAREKLEAQKAETRKAEAQKLEAQKLEAQKRLDADKQAQARDAADAKKKAQAQEQKLAALREANLKRMMGQAEGSTDAGATGTAAKTSGPSAGYAGRIKARIRSNMFFPDTVSGNPAVEVTIKLAPDGTILSSRVDKASGAPEWDAAVLRAIEKTAVLPRDIDGRVPSSMLIVYRPRD